MKSRNDLIGRGKRDYWQKHINNWKNSGLTQKQYCKSNSLAISTFCYWKKKINNPQSSVTQFYPLAIPANSLPPAPPGMLLQVGSKKFQIEIQADFSPTILKKLIATLEEL